MTPAAPMPSNRITEIQLRISFAWWIWPWLYTLILVAWVMDTQPDQVKVTKMLGRAMRVRVV